MGCCCGGDDLLTFFIFSSYLCSAIVYNQGFGLAVFLVYILTCFTFIVFSSSVGWCLLTVLRRYVIYVASQHFLLNNYTSGVPIRVAIYQQSGGLTGPLDDIWGTPKGSPLCLWLMTSFLWVLSLAQPSPDPNCLRLHKFKGRGNHLLILSRLFSLLCSTLRKGSTPPSQTILVEWVWCLNS